jgi:hypothetical protein
MTKLKGRKTGGLSGGRHCAGLPLRNLALAIDQFTNNIQVMKTMYALPTLLLAALFTLLVGCTKKSPDAPPATVPERLEIAPATASIRVGESATFALKFFDDMGKEGNVPAGVVFSSSNTGVATVNNQGVAQGVGVGQTEITARVKSLEAKALLTVVASENEIASITIEPNLKELVLNESFTLTAVARNINNQVIPGKTFFWQGNNATAVSVNSTTGAMQGKAWGTAEVTASAEGKQSAPIMVQVVRRGNFSGQGSTGSGIVKIENGILKLQTSSNFSVSGAAPDLRIYLGPNSGNVNGAVEISTLNVRNGMQSWNLPNNVSIGQFRYVIVWCKAFGGAYGVADLGN